MNTIQLYRFIKENNIEWHYRDNDGTQDVIIFPYIYNIAEFKKLLSPGIFDDEGISCVMKDGYFVFWMKDICEYYGIEIGEVFIESEEP